MIFSILMIIAIFCYVLNRGDRDSLYILSVVVSTNVFERPLNSFWGFMYEGLENRVIPVEYWTTVGLLYYCSLASLVSIQSYLIYNRFKDRPIKKMAVLNLILLFMSAVVILLSGLGYWLNYNLFYDSSVVMLTTLNLLQYLFIAGFSNGFTRIIGWCRKRLERKLAYNFRNARVSFFISNSKSSLEVDGEVSKKVVS